MNKIAYPFINALAASLFFCVALPGHADTVQPIIADQIVAVVNSSVITRNEVRDRASQVEKSLQRAGTPLPQRSVLEKQVLERLIIEQAQIQEALDDGMRVDDIQLDRAIERIAEQNKLPLQEFRNLVEKEGTTFAKFREEVRNQILLSRLREKEVDSKLTVTEGEIDNYLAEQKAASTAEVNVAQILLRVPEQAMASDIERQRLRAESIYKELAGGADFAKLAASYSDAPEALSGGELGWRTPDRLPQLFEDAVASLKPGEVAQPIKSPNGFHILKLIGTRAAPNTQSVFGDVQQTHVRHILIKVTEVVSSEQAHKRLLEIKQRIDNKSATFEDMARAHSNDASAGRGGDLGTIYPGDTVPEFERAMNALQPGQVSEPVQTQFGWHLVQVIDRKTEDVSSERKRQIARQTLRERKSDDAFNDYLRALRDRIHVEYRMEDNG